MVAKRAQVTKPKGILSSRSDLQSKSPGPQHPLGGKGISEMLPRESAFVTPIRL